MRSWALLIVLYVAACGDDAPATHDTSVAPDTSATTTADTSVEEDTSVSPDATVATDTQVVDDTVAPDDTTETTVADTTTPDDVDAGCTPIVCAGLAEQRASQELANILDDEVALGAFLRAMPKGGDLHHHLSGAVWAEQYLEWAEADGGFCIDTRTSNYLSLSRSCSADTAADVPSPDDPLYDDVIAEWSMEGFVATAGETGHDHFFSTFGKFGAISGDHGPMLADVMARAGSENQVYIELMLTSNSTAGNLGEDVWQQNHGSANFTQAQIATFFAEIKAASGLSNAIARITDDVANSENEARSILGCGSPTANAGCTVATRYQVYISRSGAQTGVFAQMVAAFEAGIVDPRVVGVNLVGPEDNTAALSRYDLQMQMLDFLYKEYRVTEKSPVHISLHAGELTDPFTPDSYPLDTINHIQKAVGIARAERIGHGVDIFFEADPDGLLDTLRSDSVLVEICLSSNDQILELHGPDHPLRDYIDAGVPVALGTDDQGVSRSSMAGEYRRAVLDQSLDYHRLKVMARDSIEHSFLPGESLWVSLEDERAVDVCIPEDGVLGSGETPSPCSEFLADNPKAKVQYELERRYRAFEANRP